MNILITGANGFIGRSLRSSNLIYKYNMIFTNRKKLDILNKQLLIDFIRTNNIDIIVHTAVTGHPGDDSVYTAAENITADLNILQMNKLVNRIIIFGSGAEYDTSKNIDRVSEDDLLFLPCPTDYYGLGKYTISRAAECIENVYNLRLFGCFGPLENETRFITNNINRIINQCNVLINKDRYFDFFYIDDLIQLIEFFCNNDSRFKQINCVYDKKYKLSDISKMICSEMIKRKPNNNVNEINGLDKSYTAEANHINYMKKIKFKGLEQGIKEMIAIKEINEKN